MELGKFLNADYMHHVDELYGPPLGSETPRGLKQLVHFLDQILPGIGVKKRFYVLDSLTHQKIVDVLGNNGRSALTRAIQVRDLILFLGHLNAHVLNALRTSEIRSLDLTASVNDADGLNLAGRDIFPGEYLS
jgi:hypothetical protein